MEHNKNVYGGGYINEVPCGERLFLQVLRWKMQKLKNEASKKRGGKIVVTRVGRQTYS